MTYDGEVFADVHLTDEEYAVIEQMAAERGMSVREIVLEALEEGARGVLSSEEIQEIEDRSEEQQRLDGLDGVR